MAGNTLVYYYFVLHAAIYFPIMARGDDTMSKSMLGQFCSVSRPCDSYVLKCIYDKCDCPSAHADVQELMSANSTCCEESTSARYIATSTAFSGNDYYCDPNRCMGQGICKCKRSDSKIINGACVERGGFYEPCLTNNDCLNEDYGLMCLNNTCQCDPTSAIDNFSSMKRQCVGLAGKEAINNECTQGAESKYEYGPWGQSRSGVCQCKYGIIEDEKGLCSIIGFGGECGLKNLEYASCRLNFSCTNFTCDCPFNLQYYDYNVDRCRSPAWGPCEMNGPKEQCVDNSVCTIKGEFSPGHAQCECLEGFVGNVKGNCEIAYGSKCEPNDITDTTIMCDQGGPLICKNGKCVCQNDLQIYIESERKCFGLVGSYCDDTNPCMEGSICVKKFYGILNGRGQCGCPNGSKVVPGRKCSNM